MSILREMYGQSITPEKIRNRLSGSQFLNKPNKELIVETSTREVNPEYCSEDTVYQEPPQPLAKRDDWALSQGNKKKRKL